MFSAAILERAARILDRYRSLGLKVAMAESCTAGLVAAALTEFGGASDVFERGFVTYSDDAKIELLGVPTALIVRHGAVSANVAIAMTEGALAHSKADVAVSVTGIAGPGGGTPQKPVGLVYLAVQRRGTPASVQRFNFGELSRSDIRMASVSEALRLVEEAISS